MTTDKIKSAAKHFGWGLLATMWNAGWASVAGVLGIDAVAITGVDTGLGGAASQARLLNWHEMLAAFAGACVLSGIQWIKAHPLPTDIDTEPPFPAPKVP